MAMNRYLLSTDCVLDIIKRRNLEAEIWFENADRRGIFDDVYISAVTPMIIQKKLTRPGDVAENESTLEDFREQADEFFQIFEGFARDSGIIAMDRAIALKWGTLLDMTITFKTPNGESSEVSSETKVEVATALVGTRGLRYVYVDYYRNWHTEFEKLIVENP